MIAPVRRARKTLTSNPWRTVLINEVLAHTDPPQQDFVELFNYSGSAVNWAIAFSPTIRRRTVT